MQGAYPAARVPRAHIKELNNFFVAGGFARWWQAAQREEEEADTPDIPTLSDEDVSLILSLLPIDDLSHAQRPMGHLPRGSVELFGGSVEPIEARHACCRCMSTIRAVEMRTLNLSTEPYSARLFCCGAARWAHYYLWRRNDWL